MWQADAHLVWAEVSMEPSPEVVFAFNSPSNPTQGLLAYIEDPLVRRQSRLEMVAAPERTEALPPIDIADWGSLDSPAAYSTALENGGAEFLRRNTGVTQSWIRLQYVNSPDGGGIRWRVTFGNPSSASYDVFLEPTTGELLVAEETP